MNENEIVYPAIFKPEEEGGYYIVFPDLDGCLSCGDTYEECLCMAKEALTGWLQVSIDGSHNIQKPSQFKANMVGIAPEPEVAQALQAYWAQCEKNEVDPAEAMAL